MRPQSLVASPSAIGSTPLASGSSVPPWPTLVLGSPACRRMRFTALTTVVEPRPTGLSRMIQPWSVTSVLPPEDDIELDRCGTVARPRVYGAELGRHEAVALHRGESFSERPDTLVKVIDRQLELNPDAPLEQRL